MGHDEPEPAVAVDGWGDRLAAVGAGRPRDEPPFAAVLGAIPAVLHQRVAARLMELLRKDSEPGSEMLDLLSQREREVLALIAEGLNNQLIAERLGIGEKTVKTHVSNVLGKLDVSDKDHDQNTMQAVTDQAGKFGSLTLDADGNWTYTLTSDMDSLDGGDVETDSFVVKSADGTEKTLTVTINGEDEPVTIEQVTLPSQPGTPTTTNTVTQNSTTNGAVTGSGANDLINGNNKPASSGMPGPGERMILS